jgi:hypothetical protein
MGNKGTIKKTEQQTIWQSICSWPVAGVAFALFIGAICNKMMIAT